MKESLLRTVVSEDTAALNIEKIVVFINNRVQIHNRNNSLKTCFLGQLPYIIDEYPGEDRYSDEQMDYFWSKLKEADHTEAYPMTEMNIDQYINCVLSFILSNPPIIFHSDSCAFC